jgi:cytochrome c oxidase subunit 2
MFSNASNLVEGVDTAFVVILSIIFFFLIGLTIVLILFIFRYREKKNPVATQIEGSTKLELLWTVIPLLLVLGMFYYGWVGWKPMYDKAPDDAIRIKAIGRMWNWKFEYANGKKTDTLYVPQGKAVVLDLVALDVIHSFYIPAFRLKQDVIPGRDIQSWFIANTPGTFDVFCAEYCGLQHSYMYTSVEVMPQNQYEKWYTDTTVVAVTVKATTPAMAGLEIVRKTGCAACHSADGSVLTGPSFKGIFGHQVTVSTGGSERTITVDEAYLIRSIIEPNADIVKGFSKGLMLSYKDMLTNEDIETIIAYIKSLE